MQSFAYAAPETVEQALDVLAEHQGAGRRAQVMAGGTDLMVQMRWSIRSPRTIVDIKKLAETNRLDVGAKEIYIGAAIPGAVLTASKPLVACLPGLGRIGRPDRLEPDSGSRIARRQSVQRIARRRHDFRARRQRRRHA